MRRLAPIVLLSGIALLAVLPAPAQAAPDVTPRVVNGEPGPSADFDYLIALGDRGRYEDVCVKVGGKWLFKTRSFRNVLAMTDTER